MPSPSPQKSFGASSRQRRGQRRLSRYAHQLQEKQQLKEIFGIRERQLRNYYQEAGLSSEATGPFMISLLERRLDNTVFRAGFAHSRAAARQLVSHGFFLLNDRSINVPSARVRAGDVVSIKETKRARGPFTNFPKSLQNVVAPSWIELDPPKYAFKILASPQAEEANIGVDVQAIVEFFAR